MEFEVKETKRVKRTFEDKEGRKCSEYRIIISCENQTGEKMKLDLEDSETAPDIGDKLSVEVDANQTKLEAVQ